MVYEILFTETIVNEHWTAYDGETEEEAIEKFRYAVKRGCYNEHNEKLRKSRQFDITSIQPK